MIKITEIIIDNEVEDIDDIVYQVTIDEKLTPEYKITLPILTWLQDNLEDLKDDYNQSIFSKVNTGFNESILKSFGKKPVCDVYINGVEYDTDFDAHTPKKVHSIVLFYLKSSNNKSYVKACMLHDLLMQEFITNQDFRHLSDVVLNTYIEDSSVNIRNMSNGMGVMGVFELTHTLY